MAASTDIEKRIAALRAQLKEQKRREKQRETEKVLQLAKRSGLSALDLQTLIQSHQSHVAGGANE